MTRVDATNRELLWNWCRLANAEWFRERARHGPSGVIEERDGLLLTAGAPAEAFGLNAALRIDPALSPGQVLDRIADFNHRHGSPRTLGLTVGWDDDLIDECSRRGLFVLDFRVLFRDRPVDDAAVTGVELRWGRSAEDLRDWGMVVSDAYTDLGFAADVTATQFTDAGILSDPRWAFVVASLGNQPVSAAGLFMSHRLGHVEWVATRKEFRNRGMGDLCTRAVTNRAFEMGAIATFLLPSPMGEAVYRSEGYRELGDVKLAVVPR